MIAGCDRRRQAMSTIHSIILALALVLLASLNAAAQSNVRAAQPFEEYSVGKRVALVIGNAGYKNSAPLRNPLSDATDISKLLRTIGFDVVMGLDLTRDDMAELIQRFADRAAGAELTLFYYAGHGMQVDGRNYLLPIDAKLERKSSLRFQTIEEEEITRIMVDTGRVAIAFLDACRDNPLSRQYALTRSVAAPRGLASPNISGSGVLLAFATAPGETANDGEGRNSPFAAALLRHLATPGIEIEQIMKRVKADVISSTDNRQRPWVSSDLAADVYLVSLKPQGPEHTAWVQGSR